jgi:hypothetical protein
LAERSSQLLGLAGPTVAAGDPFDPAATTQTLIRQLSEEIPEPLRDLDSMFLATTARIPTPEERRLVQDWPPRDVLFALVHSNEFLMND